MLSEYMNPGQIVAELVKHNRVTVVHGGILVCFDKWRFTLLAIFNTIDRECWNTIFVLVTFIRCVNDAAPLFRRSYHSRPRAIGGHPSRRYSQR